MIYLKKQESQHITLKRGYVPANHTSLLLDTYSL